VFWDEIESAAYPTPIDTWALNHGTAFVVNQMDAPEMHDLFVFSRSVGILLTASPDLKEPGTRSAWGTGSDVTLDTVQYGPPEIAIYFCGILGVLWPNHI
jgi:hypothetical protein